MSCMDWPMFSSALVTASVSPHLTPLMTAGMLCNTVAQQLCLKLHHFQMMLSDDFYQCPVGQSVTTAFFTCYWKQGISDTSSPLMQGLLQAPPAE